MTTTIHPQLANADTLPDIAHVSAKTAAAILGVAEVTVWRLAKKKKLTPKKLTARATRFCVGEIRALLRGEA